MRVERCNTSNRIQRMLVSCAMLALKPSTAVRALLRPNSPKGEREKKRGLHGARRKSGEGREKRAKREERRERRGKREEREENRHDDVGQDMGRRNDADYMR